MITEFTQLVEIPKAALRRCSYKMVFRKFATSLQEDTHAEVRFQYSCKTTILKSHFDMGVLCKFIANFQNTIL